MFVIGRRGVGYWDGSMFRRTPQGALRFTSSVEAEAHAQNRVLTDFEIVSA
jgi:carboxylesterase type B